SWRGGEMRDLHHSVGIVARECDLVCFVGGQVLEFGNAEWISGAMGVAVSGSGTRDHRGSTSAGAYFALSAGARKQNQIDRVPSFELEHQVVPLRDERAPAGFLSPFQVDVDV